MRTRYSWLMVPMTEGADDGPRPEGGGYGDSPIKRSPSPAFVRTQAFAAHFVRVAYYVRRQQPDSVRARGQISGEAAASG